MAIEDKATTIVQPIVDDLGLYLYDVVYAGKRLVVTVDAANGDGAPTAELLSLATRQISRELDERDPIATDYVLEVTSPGIERKLRRPDHFERAVGETVTMKLRDSDEGDRRLNGVITEAGVTSVKLTTPEGTDHEIDYARIQRAKIVYDWSKGINTKVRPAGDKTKETQGQ